MTSNFGEKQTETSQLNKLYLLRIITGHRLLCSNVFLLCPIAFRFELSQQFILNVIGAR